MMADGKPWYLRFAGWLKDNVPWKAIVEKAVRK